MALTERYVTSTGAGSHDGTVGNEFTLLEACTHSQTNTGQRYNIKSDATHSVSLTGVTWGAGTLGVPNVWRGYSSTIGDLDNLGRNSDGTLNTTGMPVIEITSTAGINLGSYTVLQCVNITTATSNAGVIVNVNSDYVSVISCRAYCSVSNAAARAVLLDNNISVINCDLILDSGLHNSILNADSTIHVQGCRIETASGIGIEMNASGFILDNVIIKTGSKGNYGVRVDSGITTLQVISGNTFYNFDVAVYANQTHLTGNLILIGNHATDCNYFVDSPTTSITAIAIQNRTRNMASGKSTGVEYVEIAPLDTVTGSDPSVDYQGYSSSPVNLRLKTTAEGYNAGWDGSDIGGLQTDPPSSSGVIIKQGLHTIESGVI